MYSKKEFKKIIEQYAEIKDIKPSRDPGIRNDNTTEIELDGEEIKINKHQNKTLGFEIIKLKPIYKSCELNCGNIVENQVINHTYYNDPVRYKRIKCVNCKKYQHPSGTGFVDVSSTNLTSFFRNYFLNDK